MGSCVTDSKDVSALQNAKGSSVRMKVKQGNTVVRAMFNIAEWALLVIILSPASQIPQATSVSIKKLGRRDPKS